MNVILVGYCVGMIEISFSVRHGKPGESLSALGVMLSALYIGKCCPWKRSLAGVPEKMLLQPKEWTSAGHSRPSKWSQPTVNSGLLPLSVLLCSLIGGSTCFCPFMLSTGPAAWHVCSFRVKYSKLRKICECCFLFDLICSRLLLFKTFEFF